MSPTLINNNHNNTHSFKKLSIFKEETETLADLASDNEGNQFIFFWIEPII